MAFYEALPAACPPGDIEQADLEGVYRMLAGSSPTPSDWLSHLERGKTCPAAVDECRWGSLSLQSNLVAATKLKKLPNFRGATHVAKLDIPQAAGVFKKKKSHVDFWRDMAFDISACVVELKTI